MKNRWQTLIQVCDDNKLHDDAILKEYISAQSRKLSEPIKDNHAESIEILKKLENYQKDKIAMQKLQRRFDGLRKQLDNLKMELDAKVLHCDKITEERDELRQKFEEAILDVQQKFSKFFFSGGKISMKLSVISMSFRFEKCFT